MTSQHTDVCYLLWWWQFRQPPTTTSWWRVATASWCRSTGVPTTSPRCCPAARPPHTAACPSSSQTSRAPSSRGMCPTWLWRAVAAASAVAAISRPTLISPPAPMFNNTRYRHGSRSPPHPPYTTLGGHSEKPLLVLKTESCCKQEKNNPQTV